MIFWKLFYTFCKIGIFNFGGGYAMIALIQNEVVEKNGWMTMAEFTDIVCRRSRKGRCHEVCRAGQFGVLELPACLSGGTPRGR